MSVCVQVPACACVSVPACACVCVWGGGGGGGIVVCCLGNPNFKDQTLGK